MNGGYFLNSPHVIHLDFIEDAQSEIEICYQQRASLQLQMAAASASCWGYLWLSHLPLGLYIVMFSSGLQTRILQTQFLE
jgi:hypothetical protein